MFNNVGWGEVFTLALIVLIFVGPERLPGVIKDIKAALITARNAINNTKRQLSDDIGSEFDEIARPVQEISRLTAMGPKAALTHALFDGDGSYLDAFDPKKIMSSDTQGEAYRSGRGEHTVQPEHAPLHSSAVDNTGADRTERHGTGESASGKLVPDQQPNRGGFSWDDIT